MRYIILLSVIFSLLGCSSNDNDVVQEEQQEQTTELKIKKFTITDASNQNIRKESYFDEDAKLIQYFTTENGVDGIKMDVLYNDLGQLTGVVGFLFFEGQSELWLYTENEFNNDNELEQINRFDENGSYFGAITATHFQDSIQVQKRFFLDGDTNYTLIFGSDSLLTQTNLEPHAWNPYPTVTKYTYSNGNLINIQEESNGTIYDTDFEYDDKINPLKPVLMQNYKSFILDDIGLSLAFNKTYSCSKNNISYVSDGVRSIAYQYNDLGYPISAEVTIDGELYELFSYEYY